MESSSIEKYQIPSTKLQMVRQAVRQAHGPEQSRRTHHPEQSRRANLKFQYQMTETGLGFRILVIVICLIFVICYLEFLALHHSNSLLFALALSI